MTEFEWLTSGWALAYAVPIIAIGAIAWYLERKGKL